MGRRTLISMIACAGLLAACGGHHPDPSPVPSQPETTVKVDNHDFLDMTIYVLEGSQRIRLGIASGKQVTSLTIPPYLVRRGSPLRFLCDPIGGNRAPVSEELTVVPGDEVTLIIPPS